MQNNITETTNQAAYNRRADTERHLRRHGHALCDLFSVFDAPAGFDALCDLHGILGSRHPDAAVIKTGLQEIECALGNQTSHAADSAASERGFDASAALRSHGARRTAHGSVNCKHASGMLAKTKSADQLHIAGRRGYSLGDYILSSDVR